VKLGWRGKARTEGTEDTEVLGRWISQIVIVLELVLELGFSSMLEGSGIEDRDLLCQRPGIEDEDDCWVGRNLSFRGDEEPGERRGRRRCGFRRRAW
jgi:hypothetical protein